MSLKEQIQQAQNQLAEYIATRDAAGAAALYTADACFMPHGAPTCASPEAITAFYKGAFEGGIATARFTTDNVEGDERQAVETGRYELFADGAQSSMIASGRYLVVWRKQADGWRMHRDMFNS